MKPHPRIRKTIKWGCAAVTVLLVVAWIATGWWSVQFAAARGYGASAGAGYIVIGKSMPRSELVYGVYEVPLVPGLNRYGLNEDPPWWFVWTNDSDQTALYIPFWLPVAIAFAATFMIWLPEFSLRDATRIENPLRSAKDARGGISILCAVAIAAIVLMAIWVLKR